jgi:NAD+ diphosphatase
MYSGFEVHTLDMFYECLVDDFNNVHAEDDAAEIVILRPEDVNPEDFGLDSIRKAVPIYLGKY